jgi:hypothetical protein
MIPLSGGEICLAAFPVFLWSYTVQRDFGLGSWIYSALFICGYPNSSLMYYISPVPSCLLFLFTFTDHSSIYYFPHKGFLSVVYWRQCWLSFYSISMYIVTIVAIGVRFVWECQKCKPATGSLWLPASCFMHAVHKAQCCTLLHRIINAHSTISTVMLIINRSGLSRIESWGIEARSILGGWREVIKVGIKYILRINHRETTVLCPGGNPGTWPIRI